MMSIKIGDKMHNVSGSTLEEKVYYCDTCSQHFHDKERYQKHIAHEEKMKPLYHAASEAMNKVYEIEDEEEENKARHRRMLESLIIDVDPMLEELEKESSRRDERKGE